MQGARNAATETVHAVRRGSEHRATQQTTLRSIFKTASQGEGGSKASLE